MRRLCSLCQTNYRKPWGKNQKCSVGKYDVANNVDCMFLAESFYRNG